MRRIPVWIVVLVLGSACGGGGGGSSTGFVDLRNGGNSSNLGACGLSIAVSRVGEDDPQFATLGPCGQFSFELSSGNYNVIAEPQGGACSFGPPFVQTVTVTEDRRTPLTITCGACSPC